MASVAWKKFLGEDNEAVRPLLPRTYEDGVAENRADHIRECNSKPWADAKRFVKKHDRDNRFPSSWMWPAGQQIADPEGMVAVAESELISKEECAAIIAEAEAVAQWTKCFPHASTDREASMPDRVKVDVLPATLDWLRPTLARRLCPAIELAFPGCPAAKAQNLRLYQATVLRYDSGDAAGPVSTPVHQDFSFMTMTIPLNSPNEFHGGGTWIHPLQLAVTPPVGCAVTHAGRVWHAGQPVIKGTRYAMALFFHSVATVNNGRRFEQRATTLISKGKLNEAIIELMFSLRAYTQAAVVAREQTPPVNLSEEEMETVLLHASLDRDDEEIAQEVMPEGQALWGILANLQLQIGEVEASVKSENKFMKCVERMRRESQEKGCDHPALAGVLHNLNVLQRRKAALSLND